MRPITLDDYRTLSVGDAAEPMGLAKACAVAADPEQWLPPTSPATMFRAWRALIVRHHEIDRAAKMLQEGHHQAKAADLVRARMAAVTSDIPCRDAFDATVRDRCADDDFNPFGDDAANFAVDSEPTSLDELSRRLVNLRRMFDRQDARHSYLAAIPGSFFKAERTGAADAKEVLLAIGESIRATEAALATAEAAADDRARVEAMTRAEQAAREADEARAEADRARQRMADADAAARQAEEAARMAAMINRPQGSGFLYFPGRRRRSESEEDET